MLANDDLTESDPIDLLRGVDLYSNIIFDGVTKEWAIHSSKLSLRINSFRPYFPSAHDLSIHSRHVLYIGSGDL